MNIAVIGAGIAGLRLAQRLKSDGMNVQVFDKARGPSGRLSTRRSSGGSFDHGAQYFTVRSPAFAAQVDAWLEQGVVATWDARVVTMAEGRTESESDSPMRFVGAPRMSAIARHLEADLETSFGTRILSVERDGAKFLLEVERGEPLSGFDTVISAAPAPQAVSLLAASEALSEQAGQVDMLPCHALMVRFESAVECDFDAAFVRSQDVSWAAHNASKPGREFDPSWVFHSTPQWSEAHLEASSSETCEALLRAFEQALGRRLPDVSFFSAHRWLYARPTCALADGPLWDETIGLGACGDWTLGDRVEDAFMSAESLANAIRSR